MAYVANSTSFKPGHKMFNLEKLGALEYWTEEKINEEIQSLYEWVQRDDSVCMAGWRGERSISHRALMYLKDKNAIFRDTYGLAQTIVANRLAQKQGDTVHVNCFNRYQGVYDHELKEHDKEMANIKAQSKADQDAEEAKRAYEMMQKLSNQFPSDEERKIAESKISAEAKS